MANADVKIHVIGLPMLEALYKATHRLLVLRLLGRIDTKDGLIAWNALIEAHDAIADAATNGGDTS